MRVPSFLVVIATSIPSTFGDVKFTAPDAGVAIQAASFFTVTWMEGGNLPSLSDASSCTLVLYSGSNSDPFPATTLATSIDPLSKSANVTIDADVGGSTTQPAYFLGMTTTAKAGGQVINYSHRFTIAGMTGSFTDDVKSALSGLSGTAGPGNILLDDGAARLEIRQAAVPFNEQVGPTRYAPMQPVPGTSITAQNTSPLFPTSSVVVATTFLPIPTLLTTVAAAQTNVVASKANTAAAQSQPSDDMAKFLNRWKD